MANIHRPVVARNWMVRWRLVLSWVMAGIIVAASAGQAATAESTSPSVLATADQNVVESLALQLLKTPALKRQKEESRKLLLASPVAATRDGTRTLAKVLDEMTFAAALGAANNLDPAHPRATVLFNAPQTWFGHGVPGSGVGFDNPDNAYRLITVDGASKYEIILRVRQPAPKMYSLYLYEAVIGDGSKRGFDVALAGYRESEFKPEADGSIRITVDRDPANGRPNHMQNPDDARCIYIRNMFDDWGGQVPLEVVVRRIGGPEVSKPDRNTLARRAAEILKGETNTILGMTKANFTRVVQPNTVSKPFTRGGGWGYSARGDFKLADDEALLVTLTTPPDQYLGVQVTDHWLHSVEYIHANGSLNNQQAEANRDGSYTYVITLADPGVRNWLDTGGLHEGEFLIRWQDLPEAAVAGAVRDVRLVKLADLPDLLPMEATRVNAAQRREILRQRAASYFHRYTVK